MCYLQYTYVEDTPPPSPPPSLSIPLRPICVRAPGVHGPGSGVHLRVFDPTSTRGTTGKTAGDDDPAIAVSMLSGERLAGKRCQETSVSIPVLYVLGVFYIWAPADRIEKVENWCDGAFPICR